MSHAVCSAEHWWDLEVALGVGRPPPVNRNKVGKEQSALLSACSRRAALPWVLLSVRSPRAALPWVLLASVALGLQWVSLPVPGRR